MVTQPQKPGHRGRPAGRPVRDASEALQLTVLTPDRIRDPRAVREIAELQPACLVVAAYGQILPQELLDAPRHGPVNVHASLLPRWRGASPVAHAILTGDSDTGVTIMRMDAGLDTGPIYAQRRVPIPLGATTPSLTDTLAHEGASLLADVLDSIERGDAAATAQPSVGVTLAPRLRREDGVVEWNGCSAVDIDRRVRALQPWPGVIAPLGGATVRLLEGSVAEDARSGGPAPGTIVEMSGEAVLVVARDGSAYRIERVLPSGSRAMSAAAFLRGRRSVE